MIVLVKINVSEEWLSQVQDGITVDVTEAGFNAVCDALADVGDVDSLEVVTS